MVRCRKFIEVIESEGLAASITVRGRELIEGLRSIGRERGHVANVRGVGSLVAFTLESPAARSALLKSLWERKLMALPSGPQSVRFRLPFVVTADEIATALERISDALPAGAPA
jgi:L-lysine 6-transaminase